MKFRAGLCCAFAALMSFSGAMAQAPAKLDPNSYDGHLAAAKAAAGMEFQGTLDRLCVNPSASGPDYVDSKIRSTWYAAPVKVFDNLIWLGTKTHNSWALVDPAGIIIIDTNFNYTTEDEIVGGLQKMGYDPKNIKYVILSHGHSDHDEGVKLLQDRYGARAIAGGPDWDLMLNGPDMPGGKPKRDISATDGQVVTVGKNSVTILLTPGHTAGTISYFFTVYDQGKPVVVAYSGGTSNIPLVHDPKGLQQYVDAQHKMEAMAVKLGASVVLSNHTEFDGAFHRAREMSAPRQPGDPHPFVVGPTLAQGYFKMAGECASATLLKAKGTGS